MMQTAPLNLPPLAPGDLLGFSRTGLFDSIIKVKTWSHWTHIEVYAGGDFTVASRNGKGVAKYPADLSGLYCVLRPKLAFDFDAAMLEFYRTMNGKPYGWLALFSFCLIDIHDNGIFCSELATLFYRAGGFEPFKIDRPAEKCAPMNFSYVHNSVLKVVYSDGK